MLTDIVATSAAVAATRSRKEKVAALAACLSASSVDDLAIVTAYLSGSLRQRRTGIGWRSISSLPTPASSSTLTVAEVDAAFESMASLSGSGSQTTRAAALSALLERATAPEQEWLRGVIVGNVRQGASDSLVQEAVAAASDVPLKAVRRAAMLAGGTQPIVVAAFTNPAALAEITLEVGRPVLPMLASSAPSVADALVKVGGEVAVDAKLDGIRIQVHRDGADVVIATRSLDVITSRLPEVVSMVRSLPASRVVLDGEALSIGDDGRPRAFQDTASRTAQESGAAITPYFFDLLHLDGDNLLDRPLRERLDALDRLVPQAFRTPRLITSDPASAESFVATTLAAGHEGVVVKGLDATYDAGRRGAAWVKVKPVHTVDLVVLAVEWGSGRRQGWLSNIHLGAQSAHGLVMVGKTFKGMTDEMLAWQTERFTSLAESPATIRDHYVVKVRPLQVVEIALDGVQRSSRYPGGVALRFARVVRYRDDKSPDQAETIDTLQGMLA